MEGIGYSKVFHRTRKSKALEDQLYTDRSLEELLDSEQGFLSQAEVLRAYENDLRVVLSKQDWREMISELLYIEKTLQRLRKVQELDKNVLPRIESLYSKLSPLLLRALHDSENAISKEEISKVVKEVMRVTVEDELFSYHRKVIH